MKTNQTKNLIVRNSITFLYWAEGKGFNVKAADATLVDSTTALVLRHTFLNCVVIDAAKAKAAYALLGKAEVIRLNAGCRTTAQSHNSLKAMRIGRADALCSKAYGMLREAILSK